jgi:hypothetical protein
MVLANLMFSLFSVNNYTHSKLLLSTFVSPPNLFHLFREIELILSPPLIFEA